MVSRLGSERCSAKDGQVASSGLGENIWNLATPQRKVKKKPWNSIYKTNWEAWWNLRGHQRERSGKKPDSAQCRQPRETETASSAGSHLPSHAVEDTEEPAHAAAGSVRWHRWFGDYIRLSGNSDTFILTNENVLLHTTVHWCLSWSSQKPPSCPSVAG